MQLRPSCQWWRGRQVGPKRSGRFPRYSPVAERALLVEFGETINDGIHDKVVQLDTALAAVPFGGFLEAVPAYASILVSFDPTVTDHRSVEIKLAALISAGEGDRRPHGIREVEVCYDGDLAPDLDRLADASGLTPEEVVAAHLSGDYSVFMYGFAPGYAYLAGVPQPIQLPRKEVAVRGVPAGSVLIAGQQCLVTTLSMPTGWWIIGRSPTRVLDDASKEHPFLFDVGDRVRFRRLSRAQYDAVRAP